MNGGRVQLPWDGWIPGPPRRHRGCFVEFRYVDGDADGGLNIRGYGWRWVCGRWRRVVIRAWPGSGRLNISPLSRIAAYRCLTPCLTDRAHARDRLPNIFREGRAE